MRIKRGQGQICATRTFRLPDLGAWRVECGGWSVEVVGWRPGDSSRGDRRTVAMS